MNRGLWALWAVAGLVAVAGAMRSRPASGGQREPGARPAALQPAQPSLPEAASPVPAAPISTPITGSVVVNAPQPSSRIPPVTGVRRRYLADCTGDGQLSAADVAQFVQQWQMRRSSADFNHDGKVDVTDATAYLGAFQAASWIRTCGC